MKKIICFSSFTALLLLLGVVSPAQEYGIEERVSNTTLLITELPDDGPPGQMEPVRVFDQLSFSFLVYLAHPPGDSSRFFAVQQSGEIRVFPNRQDVTSSEVNTFLDISSQVWNSGERGLLGLAFDPDYLSNGEFYVHYTYPDGQDGTTRLSRFTNDDPLDNSVDPETEEILFELEQPYGNHNGGSIEFGPDGMLYMGLGDGGLANDPLEAGQDLTTILGKILRIDVRSEPDPGLSYAIPDDNPFVDREPSVRKEIYAYGLRNPWRFSFDMLDGTLYCGDVGQNAWEEVDVIVSGGNYGWDIMEGAHCRGNAPSCATTEEMLLPIAEYENPEVGRSITGGYVYYGSEVPELYGKYLYADYVSGLVFSLVYDGTSVSGPYRVAENTGLNIASFGQDASGEVYICARNTGEIYVLRPEQTGGGGSFPNRLSDMSALLAAGSGIDQTTEGIIPYVPSAKLWSDGALKERYVAMPDLLQAGYTEQNGWNFPEETLIVKNFLLPLDERDAEETAKRIETRLLYKKDGDWHGFSYEWNEEETDAVLLRNSKTRPFTITGEDGEEFAYEWYYPSRTDCLVCHTAASNRVLGLTTPQLNSQFEYPASGVTDNQLRTLDHIEFFAEPLPGPPDSLPRMPDPENTQEPLRDRARAYLTANCAICHQPGGPTNSPLDLRWLTPDDEMVAIGVDPSNDMDIENAKVIASGDPERSVLYLRMNMRGSALQMPPLATSRIDEFAVGLVGDWIESLAQEQAAMWQVR